MSQSHYGGVHEFDQLQSEAVAKLRNCQSFILITEHLEEGNPMEGEPSISRLAAVRGPMPMYFLAKGTELTAELPTQAMEDLLDEISDETPS